MGSGADIRGSMKSCQALAREPTAFNAGFSNHISQTCKSSVLLSQAYSQKQDLVLSDSNRNNSSKSHQMMSMIVLFPLPNMHLGPQVGVKCIHGSNGSGVCLCQAICLSHTLVVEV